MESGKEGGKHPRYQLRHAAGLYWLTDLEQDGIPCKMPLVLNRVGADIWRLAEKGEGPEAIAERISREYEGDRQRIREDIRLFYEKMKEQGIV